MNISNAIIVTYLRGSNSNKNLNFPIRIGKVLQATSQELWFIFCLWKSKRKQTKNLLNFLPVFLHISLLGKPYFTQTRLDVLRSCDNNCYIIRINVTFFDKQSGTANINPVFQRRLIKYVCNQSGLLFTIYFLL